MLELSHANGVEDGVLTVVESWERVNDAGQQEVGMKGFRLLFEDISKDMLRIQYHASFERCCYRPAEISCYQSASHALDNKSQQTSYSKVAY